MVAYPHYTHYIGIGPTKFLAKLADHIAKSILDMVGFCDLTDPVAYDHWLCRISVAEVWGIGRASLAKRMGLGVDTVADLRDLDPQPVRKAMTGVGERIIYELRGARLPVARADAGPAQGLRGHPLVLPAHHRARDP